MTDDGFNGKDRILLARLDERTQRLEVAMQYYVRHERYVIVERITFGLVTLCLTAVTVAIMKLVVWGA